MKRYRFALAITVILFTVAMTVVPLWATTLYVNKWTEFGSNPVFDPTEKTYYPCVIKISDTYQMYYADENSIRYTTSSDGINWSNGTEITFTIGPTPVKQNHPWVVYNGSEYKLWYWDSINSSTSKLYMATSSDGISWAEQSAISITSGMAYSFFYNARVLWNGTNYEGWFDNNGGKIEYANSGNGIDWETATPCVFNGYGGAFTPPCVVKLNDTYYMWFGYKAVDPEPNGYSNTGIGYANSSNGINWQIKFSPIFAINDSGATWRNYRTYTPNVIKEDNTWKIWFTGKSSDGNYAIGYAATNYWEPDYTIIQEAVDAANSGDTISVAAGTYNETVTINKSLTLRGATYNLNKNGYTVPADYAWDNAIESIINHPDPASGYDAIVDIYDIDNITFEGFVVQELSAVGNLNSSLVRVRAQTQAISNIIVRNNIIGPNTNTSSQDGAQGRMGLYIVNNPYSGDYGVINSTFSGNKIFDCQGNGNNVFVWSSYYAYGALSRASMSGTVIEDNEIYGSRRSGIETAGGYSDLTIRNNKIYSNASINGGSYDEKLKYGHGIMLIRGASDKLADSDHAYGPENLTIENNDIYDNEKSGIYMGPMNKNYSITGNEIHNNGYDGIMLDLEGRYWNGTFEPAPSPADKYACYDGSTNIIANFNNICDNTQYGVRIVGTPTNGFVFDANSNWWSDNDPSNDVNNNVIYSPWLNDSLADFEKAETQTRTDIGPSGGQVKVSITSTPDVSNYLDVYQVGSLSGSPVISGETFPGGFDKRSNIIWGINKTGTVTATMVFDYSNQPGISDVSTIEILKRDNAQDNTWEEVAETSRDDAAKTITLTDVTEFSEFALGAGSENALPVKLTSFTAKNRSGGVLLEWRTESETENQGYILEKLTIEDGKLTIKDEEWATVADYLSDAALVGQGSTTESHMYQYVDNAVQSGVTYAYRLGDVDYNSKITWHKKVEVKIEAGGTKVPAEFGLQKVYPNPFNPSVTLSYGLTEDAQTTLLIYDMSGQLIQTLQNAFQSAGTYHITWQPVNLSSGVYIVHLRSGNNTNLQKVVFVK